MASPLVFSGRLALFAGLTATALGALFAYLNEGLQYSPFLEEMPLAPEEVIPNLVATLLYKYTTPFLCAVAFFFGLRAIRIWTGQIGFAAASLALIAYLIFLRACIDTLAVAS